MSFYIEHINLTCSKQELERFAEELYQKHYKKYRLLHITGENKLYPQLKITGDLASFSFFFFDQFQNEHHFFLDGRYVKKEDQIILNSMTPDSLEELNEIEQKEILQNLLRLTQCCQGYALIIDHDQPKRIQNGKIDRSDALLNEMLASVTDSEKSKLEPLFQLFKNCF